MEKLELKLHHLWYSWYYKKVPVFFRKWTFRKSVDLLRQNYEHSQFENDQKDKLIHEAIKSEQKLRDELASIKIKLVAGNDAVKWSNEKFGTNFNDASDN